ncbi:2-oxo-4-hydroxy-4-carboxy-5-ureidoimidazoline decarboxylase [Streptosporangium sp. NBC_01755]|uniref:2-oxo-4-hydroxy-4-carboxy-5-ureidoimidazoline decarboxylase n=1 Tax=unclassified Streptosporangium TaxID=2632669 RepID=UPI002DDB3685|nr:MULTISPECIES: 2-oxo-4-hydroxy-4-carboxy-5-ureidoimidazoline decarboxylase [unclassified Streptosporangium]WSA22930.1 2-oxo-4-hydroxy-4-carboxy-5-ureidoimidazoline decarboxylase [Streptosporangium sp. NBC_01810]WSC98927.1 2-oxo-4-hydroxy-4-carboxy-5-ureidoimidazoline decarboxylase [Streptosporangium sp. NBC_01755]
MSNVHSAPQVAGLAAFNALGAEEAEAELLACCACRGFAAKVAALRPYRDPGRLTEVAEATVRSLDWSGVREALAAHPRIGEPPRESDPAAGHSGREADWSRREQSGVETAGREVLDRLAEGNRAYERRFGHVYLICATGLPAEEMLARLTERLGNDEDTERDVVRAELGKITRLRLVKLLESGHLAPVLPRTAT